MKAWNMIEDDSFSAGETDLQNFGKKIVKLEDALILLYREGLARVEIDARPYSIVPQTRILLLPGSILHILEVSEHFRASFVSFTAELFRETTGRIEPSVFFAFKDNPCVMLTEEKDVFTEYFIQFMCNLFHDRDNCFRKLMARNMIQNFLLDLGDKVRRFSPRPYAFCSTQGEELFRRFILLVHEYGAVEREVSFYADRLYITSRYLSTIIRKISNKTPKELINEQAILEMKMLLQSTPLTIKEIAQRLKFPNESFFGKFFKREIGMSPSEYRKTET